MGQEGLLIPVYSSPPHSLYLCLQFVIFWDLPRGGGCPRRMQTAAMGLWRVSLTLAEEELKPVVPN